VASELLAKVAEVLALEGIELPQKGDLLVGKNIIMIHNDEVLILKESSDEVVVVHQFKRNGFTNLGDKIADTLREKGLLVEFSNH